MRRSANLFDRIYEPENLRLAFHKAARGRRGQTVVQQFADSVQGKNRLKATHQRWCPDFSRSLYTIQISIA